MTLQTGANHVWKSISHGNSLFFKLMLFVLRACTVLAGLICAHRLRTAAALDVRLRPAESGGRSLDASTFVLRPVQVAAAPVRRVQYVVWRRPLQEAALLRGPRVVPPRPQGPPLRWSEASVLHARRRRVRELSRLRFRVFLPPPPAPLHQSRQPSARLPKREREHPASSSTRAPPLQRPAYVDIGEHWLLRPLWGASGRRPPLRPPPLHRPRPVVGIAFAAATLARVLALFPTAPPVAALLRVGVMADHSAPRKHGKKNGHGQGPDVVVRLGPDALHRPAAAARRRWLVARRRWLLGRQRERVRARADTELRALLARVAAADTQTATAAGAGRGGGERDTLRFLPRSTAASRPAALISRARATS